MLASGSPPDLIAGPVRTSSTSRGTPKHSYSAFKTINTGRTIPPSRVRDVSTVETITSTFSALSKHASTGLSTLSTAAAARDPRYKAVRQPQEDGDRLGGLEALSSSPSPIFDAMGGNADPNLHRDKDDEDILAGKLASMRDLLRRTEKVTWSAWDSLPRDVEPASSSRHALLIAYASGGLQIFIHSGTAGQTDSRSKSRRNSSCHSDQELREILNFQQFLLPGDRVAGRVLAAKLHSTADGQPCLLLVTATAGESNGLTVSRCSLTSQMVNKSTALPGLNDTSSFADAVATSTLLTSAIQLGNTHVVVAQSHPPALHVLDVATLTSVMDPIADVASSSRSLDITPAFHLSGRMLAYASTTPDRSPNCISFGTAGQIGGLSVHKSPYRGTNTSPYTTAEQVRLSALEAGAQASDIAKKVGGGLMAGAKNLGGWGSSYISAYAGATSSSPQHTTSQPTPSTPREPASGLPRLLNSAAQHSSAPLSSRPAIDSGVKQASCKNERRVPKASTVKILDLLSAGSTKNPSIVRVSTSFRPTSAHIAAVKLSPDSSHIFVADSSGHSFNVFEIRPRARGLPAHSLPPPALHRFRLLRGVTTAHVCDAQWTLDGQWLGVLTYNGTAHTYRLGPASGPKALHMGASLTSFARTPRPRQPTSQEADDLSPTDSVPGDPPSMGTHSPPAFTFVNPSGSQPIEGLDVLVFHPSVAALTMSKVTLAHTTLAESIVTSASEATDRVSGLTVMMRRATIGSGAATGHHSVPSPPMLGANSHHSARWQPQQYQRRLRGECAALAIWNGLARTHDAPEVQPVLTASQATPLSGPLPPAKAPARGWASMAEIETYDSAPRALPTSKYLSHQIKLRTFTHPTDLPVRSEPLLVDVPRSKTRLLQTRESVLVEMTPGVAVAESSSDNGLSLAIASPAFEAPDFIDGQPPSQCIPSFPQGQAARRPSWRKSVAHSVTTPIRITAAASKDIGRGVVGSLRKPGAKRGGISSFSRSSPREVGLSFDEDITHDAHIFADAREAQPSPNGGPSSLVSAGGNSSGGGAATTSTGSGSADTAGTVISEALEDDMGADEEERYWAAARGMQEDVEGDQLGWDSFAEFHAKGGNGHQKDNNTCHDDFLVGGLALDEDVGNNVVGATRGEAATLSRGAGHSHSKTSSSPPSMPPFSRKSISSGTSYRSGSGSGGGSSFTPVKASTSFNLGDVNSNGEGTESGSEGGKHTSTVVRSSGSAASIPTPVPRPSTTPSDVPTDPPAPSTATASPAIAIKSAYPIPGSLPSPLSTTLPLSLGAGVGAASLSSSSSSSMSSTQRKGKKK